MPEKPLIEQYIQEKAKRNEMIDYKVINDNFIKCEFCGRLYHIKGIFKHEIFCVLNPDKKKTYETKRLWTCRFCNLLFTHNKEKNLHESRCSKNSKVIIINSKIGNKDKLELCKREFPDIYNILTLQQKKVFLNHVKS